MYRCRSNFEGYQEVACGQWEFQLFAQGAKKKVTKYARYLWIA
jgi:hypothetical protein